MNRDKSNTINRLFVYGTLRTGSSHPIARMLKEHTIKKINAYFHGQLYDAGEYPAAVKTDNKSNKVFGELLLLDKPNSIISRLDDYEGYNPSKPSKSLFIRKKIRVYINDADSQIAWIYLFNKSIENIPKIPSGNYKKYIAG